MKAVLVYQAGLANVFAVSSFNMSPFGRKARRLMQADFAACENFARGLAAAGWHVASAQCNQAGDIIEARWSDDVDAMPFRDAARPVWSKVHPMLA